MSQDQLNVDDILAMEVGAPAEVEPTSREDLAPSTEDVDQILSMRTTDGAIGIPIRSELSGATADSAIPSEPVLDLADRARLGLGNREGNLKYLKEKFPDATYNGADRLTVKTEDGKWYLADPDVGDPNSALSPWELSKELFADTVLDQAQPLMMGVSGVLGAAAGTLAAPGPGTVGGAGVGVAFGEYLRTSMGRYVGTYEATPVEQTRDIAFESLMEMGGQKFLPGMKPTAKKVLAGLEGMAKKFGKKGADIFWDTYGRMATSSEVTRTFRKNPKLVMKIMKDNGGALSYPARYVTNIVDGKINDVRKLVESSDQMLGKAYMGVRNQIAKITPDNFYGDARMYSTNAYLQLVNDGAASITVKGAKPDERQLAGILQFMKTKGRLPKGVQVNLRSQRELQAIANSGVPVPDAIRLAAVDPDSYAALKQTHGILQGFTSNYKAQPIRGKEAMHRLLEDKKSLSNLVYNIADDSKLASKGNITGYLHGLRKQMDKQTTQHLSNFNPKLADKFTEMNGVYSQYSDYLMPLQRANKRVKQGDVQAVETMMNQLASNPSKNITKKGSVQHLIKLTEKMGDKAATKRLTWLNERLEAADAAIALNPYVNKSGGTEMAMGLYAVASKNMALGAAVGGRFAATNATLQQGALRANYHLWNGLKQIKGMSKRELEFLADNPAAVTSIIRSISDAEQRQTAVENAFSNAFPPAPLMGAGDE